MAHLLPALRVQDHIAAIIPPPGMKPYHREVLFNDQPTGQVFGPPLPVKTIDPKDYYITSGDAVAKAKQLLIDQYEFRYYLVEHILARPPKPSDQKCFEAVDGVIEQTTRWINLLLELKGDAFCVEFSHSEFGPSFRLTTPRSQPRTTMTRDEKRQKRKLQKEQRLLNAV